jgi:fatty-acyl-CoA synthase
MTIDHWIQAAAKATPDRTAIAFHDQSLSYAAFNTLIKARAAQLHAEGITKGDRIAWLGFNAPEVFVLLFSAARLGAILVPLNWRLADEELQGILRDCAPKLVFHDAKATARAKVLAGQIAQSVWPSETGEAPAPEAGTLIDPILIVYTSGSTGQPKGAVLAQQALVANAKMSVESHRLIPEDRVLVVLPLFHVGGLNILPTPAFSIGASVVLQETFDPVLAFEALKTVDTAIVVPTVLQAIMAQPGWKTTDFANLRGLSIGSTDVPESLIEAVHAKGVPLVQVYGTTETAPFAIYQTMDNAMATAGSIGRAGSGCDIRIVRSEGSIAYVGEPGEIQVKGPNTLLRYWQNPRLTEEALVNGWFRTGDVACVDADGYYWFRDRIKHVIISGGENIYPAEIERIIRTAPSVSEVCVVGQDDPRWGETPVAVVVAAGEPSEAEIFEHLDGKLARYKRPSKVVFVDALPRNAMGKIVAAEVRMLIQSL